MIELLGSPKRPADGGLPCRNGRIQAATGVMIGFPRGKLPSPIFTVQSFLMKHIIYIYIHVHTVSPMWVRIKLNLPSRRIRVRWTKRNRHVMLGLLRWIPISSQPTQPFRFPRDISGGNPVLNIIGMSTYPRYHYHYVFSNAVTVSITITRLLALYFLSSPLDHYGLS